MTSFACDYYKLHNSFSISWTWLNINCFAYEIAVSAVVFLSNSIIVLHTTNYFFIKRPKKYVTDKWIPNRCPKSPLFQTIENSIIDSMALATCFNYSLTDRIRSEKLSMKILIINRQEKHTTKVKERANTV